MVINSSIKSNNQARIYWRPSIASMSLIWHHLTNSRFLPVAITAFGIATFAFSPLYIGDRFGMSFHFQSAWLSTLVWVSLAVATCGLWSWYLYLKAVSTTDKKGLYWQKFGASLALLGMFMFWVFIRGSLDYYFSTLMSGSDRIHQLVESINLRNGTRLVMYWCIEPSLSPCIRILAVQKQLPFGTVIERTLHHKEGSTECTLKVENDSAVLEYDSQTFTFPLDVDYFSVE